MHATGATINKQVSVMKKGESPAREGPELVLALCAAVGTDLEIIAKSLGKEFTSYGYQAEHIRVSQLFADAPGFGHLKNKSLGEDERIEQSMKAGDRIRELERAGSGVSRMIVSEIRERRKSITGSYDELAAGTVYIIKSLKHPEEYDHLRVLYGDAFYMISVYEPIQKRKETLARHIARSYKSQDIAKYFPRAIELIRLDEKEDEKPLGQNVRETFPKGDFFVEVGGNAHLNDQLARLASLLFGAPFVTPTKEEYAMFHAYAAALKSADLSRQVGAVIVASNGEIVTAGCNEVPKAGGGLIWEDDIDQGYEDRRDFAVAGDAAALMKREMLGEVFAALKQHGWLCEDQSNKELEALVDEAPLKGARVSNILEFGRIIHAEMAAITEAAREGRAVRGLKLYCTTFPCHMCARHIIAAGLTEVIYIEPYPKSLVGRLYEKEIVSDSEMPAETLPGAVVFRPFMGVSPKRYAAWFLMVPTSPRKDKVGLPASRDGSVARRRFGRIVNVIPPSEVANMPTRRVLGEGEINAGSPAEAKPTRKSIGGRKGDQGAPKGKDRKSSKGRDSESRRQNS